MRKVWFGLIVLAVCTPIALVALLLAAVQFPAMDKVTLAMPPDVRATVAAIVIQRSGYGKDSLGKIQRVLRLQPENPKAWSGLCSIQADSDQTAPVLETCAHAVKLDPDDGANLEYLAGAQEKAGDFCTAEETYTAANRAVSDDPDDLRGMGRSALQCGRIPYSIAELEAARDLDLKHSTDPNDDDDDVDDYKADLQVDREWLVLAYAAARRPTDAAEVCSQAHPAWKTCSCTLRKGKPACSGT